jgi:hypothetical protein
MPELAPSPDLWVRHADRVQGIVGLNAQLARLESQLRSEINALTLDDTPFGFRKFVGDELALHLAESPITADRWVAEAQRFCSYPAVMERVEAGQWTIRHADALLDEITGVGLTGTRQQEVVVLVSSHPDARTPYQIRRAAQAAIMMVDPDAAERRHDKAKKDRRTGSDSHADGSASFWATGTKSQIAMVTASLDALAGPAQPDDPRSLAQRRFDAFMDLVCGRLLPGQWQAQVLVSLATLEGEPVPAEIPGLGLITAGEARELLSAASLRRLVVDANGKLMSVDSTLHQPDLAADVAVDDSRPAGRLLSAEVAPDAEESAEDPSTDPDSDDLDWLQAQLDEPDSGAEPAESWEATFEVLSHELEDTVLQLLEQSALVGAGFGPGDAAGGAGSNVDTRWNALIDVARWTHGTDGPPTPGGLNGGPGVGPGDDDPDHAGPRPEPDPPTFSDLDWHDSTVDREVQDAGLPPPTCHREPDPPDPDDPVRPPPRPAGFWTLGALQRAVGQLLRTPVDTRPLNSPSYVLPPRLARHVKTRDQTCTFPGCRRLARECQNDHIVRWPEGPTSDDNIASECPHHHQGKHGYFAVRRTPDGTLHWTTPSGLTVSRPVQPLLRGW